MKPEKKENYEKLLPNILYQNDTAAKMTMLCRIYSCAVALPFATYFSCSLSLPCLTVIAQ